MAVSAKFTVTEEELPVPEPPELVDPVPFAPAWMATALRAGTVALNDPPETVKLVALIRSCLKVGELNGHVRATGTVASRNGAADDIAVCPVCERGCERCGPRRVGIVDCNEASSA